MSPGGEHGLAYIIYGVVGAAIVFGAAWLVTLILPLVPTLSFGSTTGWVLCGVGAGAGLLLCQVSLHGWREMWRSWATWAMIVVPVMGLGSIVGWYFNANPDSALVETITELVNRVPEGALVPIVVLLPILGFVIMFAVAIVKYNIDRRR